ncbi:MAG: flagellar protein [Spirochaetaceae bacterium]|nr:MAG: flagellar protein [Spirochaetaceae bacterium]
MKRIFIFLVIAIVAGSAFATESTLIDFTLLGPDVVVGQGDQARDEHERTLVDFADVAGASFTEEERGLMKASLYISNWEVMLNSSAQTARSQANSKVLPATVRDNAPDFAGDTVLGARVVFPTEPHNAWALIRPPFEIQAYADRTEVDGAGNVVPVQGNDIRRGDKFEDGFGVIKNVGTIKQIGLNVYGLNFPHSISVILQDERNRQHEVFMGNMQFDGWRRLVWDNPNYIADVRDRELRTFPLYPQLQPMMKLIGFRVYRDAAHVGGDFITYIRDVALVYDRARLELQEAIDHDQLWGILDQRESDRRRVELQRLGNQQVLRFIERQLQADPELDLRNR